MQSGTFPPREEPKKDGSGLYDTMVHVPVVVIPDLVSTNQQEGTTVYDVVVVGVTHKDGFKGAAAARAEKKKHEHFNNHKRKCRDEENTYSRLDVELIPSTGSYGRSGERSKRARQRPETCIRNHGATDKQRIGGDSFQRAYGSRPPSNEARPKLQ